MPVVELDDVCARCRAPGEWLVAAVVVCTTHLHSARAVIGYGASLGRLAAPTTERNTPVTTDPLPCMLARCEVPRDADEHYLRASQAAKDAVRNGQAANVEAGLRAFRVNTVGELDPDALETFVAMTAGEA